MTFPLMPGLLSADQKERAEARLLAERRVPADMPRK
jgi:hypothetical protein